MVDRKSLVESWQQIEQALCEMDNTKHATVRSEESWWEQNTPRLIKGGYRCLWLILEYLVRRDKA